jgi:hypothetical protein
LLSVCVSPVVARQRLSKHVPAATNTHSTTEKLSHVVFSTHSVSYQTIIMQLKERSGSVRSRNSCNNSEDVRISSVSRKTAFSVLLAV